MMSLRRIGLALVVLLAIADAAGAAYLWLLWHDRPGSHLRDSHADARVRH